MKNLRHGRFWDKGLVGLAAVGLAVGCAMLCIFPAPRFSAAENRNLTEWPVLTAAGLGDGSYTAALEAYATERFPARSLLRQTRSLFHLAQGTCEVGGVLLCRDGSLAKRMTVNHRALAQNLAALQKLGTLTALPVTIAVAPRRIDARTAVLPALYSPEENKPVWAQLLAALPEAVTFSTLTADAHWYRTDHHWTTEGAYAAYVALAKQLHFAPYGQEDFTTTVVSDRFYGTSHAAAGIPFLRTDSITLYRYESDGHFTLLLDGKLAPFEGFYDFDKLQTRDGYGVFFGGNYGTLEITDGTDRESLLVIKDSFANALLPFLARHFDLLAIDPRYTAEPLSAFTEKADRILVLCGMQTLCETPVLRTLTAT